MKRLLVVALLGAQAVCAQETLPLYPGAIPGAIESPDEEAIRDPKDPFPFLLNVSRPTLTVYLPSGNSPTPAVLIFPGGSYRGVSIVKEGHDVARAFNAMGIAAVVVKYRTPNARHMVDRTTGPLQDAQQAMRVVRSRAAQWNIDPQRVGIVGFSAGGHLAATAAMRFDQSLIVDAGAANLRPDFLVLLYPVISMSDSLTHAVSRTNLLGEAPTAELVQRYSMDLHVHANAPPTFLMHAADDKAVKVDNTLRLFEALQAKQISTELHIYPRGGHGFGLKNATTDDQWIERCRNWLVSQGLLTLIPAYAGMTTMIASPRGAQPLPH